MSLVEGSTFIYTPAPLVPQPAGEPLLHRRLQPGSPRQNPWVESSNSRVRDELFAREIFTSIMEAKVLDNDWRHIYNHDRPHSALGYQPPAVFEAGLNHPKLS